MSKKTTFSTDNKPNYNAINFVQMLDSISNANEDSTISEPKAAEPKAVKAVPLEEDELKVMQIIDESSISEALNVLPPAAKKKVMKAKSYYLKKETIDTIEKLSKQRGCNSSKTVQDILDLFFSGSLSRKG